MRILIIVNTFLPCYKLARIVCETRVKNNILSIVLCFNRNQLITVSKVYILQIPATQNQNIARQLNHDTQKKCIIIVTTIIFNLVGQ